ncbi:MAG: adenosine kinase [Alphaproteobacteria bacterium]|nr:adenosine kinase [Alphaproteobacteria bacterium]MCA0448618.1 adenosine kinase [Pseudomonadota bacterium]
MTSTKYDVLGIGNAIVDVIARCEDPFLAANNLAKGAMTLIDEARAGELYAAMGPGLECSGGSAGNTIAGLANLGGKGAYIGRVRDDQLGTIFRHDIRAQGVAFDSAPATSGPSTARCLIFVTPDAQRTMQTYLGACVDLGPDQIDEAVVAASGITYMEGYLWDKPAAKDAFRKAAQLAHKHGRKVSLTLSDSFCVDRHRADFRDLADNHCDIVFANEAELLSLYQVKSFEEALPHARAKKDRIFAVTRSEKGSVAIQGDRVVAVPAEPGVNVVDTTGAGDLYASGFLLGLAQGRDLAQAARLGSICAAEIISHYGARPETSLKELAASKGAL